MRRLLVLGLNHVTVAPSEPVIRSMLPRTDHSVPEGWVVVPLNETELALTSSMRAVIPVKPVTTPASKLTISPMLVMRCGFSCSSSAFIVPSHDSVRTAALADSKVQINAKATIRIRDIAMLCPGTTPRHGADGVSLPSSPIAAAEAGYSSATAGHPCFGQLSGGRTTQNNTPLLGPTCLGAQTCAPPSGATTLLILSLGTGVHSPSTLTS